VRDCLHPRDLVPLLQQQLQAPRCDFAERIVNASGGAASAMSLRQLTAWCDERFGAHPVASDAQPRPFDLPWVVLDHQRASQRWSWAPQTPLAQILEQIAEHAVARPEWLDVSAPL
jgi:CDP-paratose 2-epimerase